MDKDTAKTEARRAKRLRESGELDAALEIYDALIEAFPVGALVFERANTHFDCGEYGKAIRDYDYCHELDPHDPDVLINRGNAHFRLGNAEQALEDFELSLTLSTNLKEAHNSRGLALEELGFRSKAIDSFRTAIELDEGYLSPRYNLARLLFRQSQNKQALQQIEDALAIDPVDESCYRLRKRILHRSNEESEAE
jgi:tetratricopeptide (TPR) repeat protein